MTTTNDDDLHAKLTRMGYLNVQDKGEAGAVGITRLMMSCAVVGGLDATGGYKVRRRYPSFEIAKAALDAWDGNGEPPPSRVAIDTIINQGEKLDVRYL